MIVRELIWSAPSDNERIRTARFSRRVPFGMEVVASVANAMADQLRELLAASVQVDIFPPVVLEEGAWESLCDDAFVYEIAGERCDAALLCSKRSALHIARHAFGEDFADAKLSVLELQVIDGFMARAATSLSALCGTTRIVSARAIRSPRREVYCELRIGGPLAASLGIATSRPAAEIGALVSASALDDCRIECAARLAVGAVDIFTIAGLAVGDILPLEAKVAPSATLNVGPNVIAAGEGGVLGDRTAFKVHELI